MKKKEPPKSKPLKSLKKSKVREIKEKVREMGRERDVDYFLP